MLGVSTCPKPCANEPICGRPQDLAARTKHNAQLKNGIARGGDNQMDTLARSQSPGGANEVDGEGPNHPT
eukprot:11208275-Lingulodinium_polyedra.AAC.1